MHVDMSLNRNHSNWFANDVIRAIKHYGMIDAGDRVCAAVSGGKDSAALLFILEYLRRYSFLDFDLTAIHVRIADYDTTPLREFCAELGVPYFEAGLRRDRDAVGKGLCYTCARLKRGAMRETLLQRGIRKVAYGHHANDAVETFFMNVVHNRRLAALAPKLVGAENEMVIVRPLIYLAEATLLAIHRHFGLPQLGYQCPHAETNVRKDFKESVTRLDEVFHTQGFVRKFVDALGNIDETGLPRPETHA